MTDLLEFGGMVTVFFAGWLLGAFLRRPVKCLSALRWVLCKHSTVEVFRSHADVVPANRRDKVLYVDRHNVWNFVRCCNCEAFLNTKQKERLFEQKAEDGLARI